MDSPYIFYPTIVITGLNRKNPLKRWDFFQSTLAVVDF